MSRVPDGEQLLGRVVTERADGTWTIANERAPGCEVVSVDRMSVRERHQHHVRVNDLTALNANYAKLVELKTRLRRFSTADIDIETVGIRKPQLRGRCGSKVVSVVYVGTGRLKLYASDDRRVAGSVGIAKLGVDANHESGAEVGSDESWQTPMTYGFDIADFDSHASVLVEAQVPSILVDGDLLEFPITASDNAYLIVYVIDEKGEGSVLWPSNEEPEPMVSPSAPTQLPSAREKARNIVYRMQLENPQTLSRERLIIYAFRELADFHAVKPQAVDAAGLASYLKRLESKLRDIPAHRWGRAQFEYEVRPLGGTPRPQAP